MNDVRNICKKYNLVINKILKFNDSYVIDTKDEKFFLKRKKDAHIYDVISYLKSRHFNNFLEFNSREEDSFYITKFIEDSNLLNEDRAMELIYLVSLLHTKTTFYKSISLDSVKCFYETKINDLENIRNYYDSICYSCIDNVFLSPSKFLIVKNMSLIFSVIDCCRKYLDMWYEIMKDKKCKRMVLNHNNLKLSHVLVNSNSYLISWDNAVFDVPVIDLCSFFKNEFFNIDIKMMFNVYYSKYQLTKDEIYLFYHYLLFPDKCEFNSLEIENCKEVYFFITYLNKVNDFILENGLYCNK